MPPRISDERSPTQATHTSHPRTKMLSLNKLSMALLHQPAWTQPPSEVTYTHNRDATYSIVAHPPPPKSVPHPPTEHRPLHAHDFPIPAPVPLSPENSYKPPFLNLTPADAHNDVTMRDPLPNHSRHPVPQLNPPPQSTLTLTHSEGNIPLIFVPLPNLNQASSPNDPIVRLKAAVEPNTTPSIRAPT